MSRTEIGGRRARKELLDQRISLSNSSDLESVPLGTVPFLLLTKLGWLIKHVPSHVLPVPVPNIYSATCACIRK
jgi:hypothetical protein